MNLISEIIIDINFKIEVHREFNDKQVYRNIEKIDEITFNDDDIKYFFCEKFRYFTCRKILQCFICKKVFQCFTCKKLLHDNKTFFI